jgi:heterodisulfide reductase subunit A-like polyferredoxin
VVFAGDLYLEFALEGAELGKVVLFLENDSTLGGYVSQISTLLVVELIQEM